MRTIRSTAVLTGAAATLLLLAGPAAAHVTAHSYDAVSGGQDTEISFRVPNEESASTAKVVITFPTEAPLAGVLPEPKPGWKVATTTVKLAKPIDTDDGSITTTISTITWTATAGGTPSGQYDDFDVAVGLLPAADSITFKALQTYSDGSVVRWIETGADAEHPAPVLALSRSTEAAPTATASPTVAASAPPAAVAETTDNSDDSTATALGGTGLGVAVLAALLALAALLRGRSSTS